MKRLIKWGFILGLIIFVGGYLFSPSRIYGYLFSKDIEATVNDIRSFNSADNKGSETFAVELHTKDGQIHIATTCEKVWGVIAKGDRVKVRLYPAAPWSQSDGSWINAKLFCKMTKTP
ncbi:MAG: hypothetical protein JXA82_16470 [Sedimentisphaerales bacterium]|nr:hypothetical protein [Sedimentisphaerales bacterium]